MRRPPPPKALTLGQRRAAAAKAIIEAQQHGSPFDPVRASGPAWTHWGRAWVDHFEREPAWAGLLERGRSVPRDGLVIDLRVRPGSVDARVQCHELHSVHVDVPVITDDELEALRAALAGELTSVAALRAGQLSDRAAAALRDPRGGLLPEPARLRHSCTCGERDALCRHVAAALYAVGHRHDREPDLVFPLRGVDADALVAACARPPGAPAPAPPARAPAPPPAPPARAPTPPPPAGSDPEAAAFEAAAVAAVRARVAGLRARGRTQPLTAAEAHLLSVFEPWLRARGG
jgi:hypothetical protein